MRKTATQTPKNALSAYVGDFGAIPDALFDFFEFLMSVDVKGCVYNRDFPDLSKLKDLYAATIAAIRALRPDNHAHRRRKLAILGWIAENDETLRPALADEINALIQELQQPDDEYLPLEKTKGGDNGQ